MPQTSVRIEPYPLVANDKELEKIRLCRESIEKTTLPEFIKKWETVKKDIGSKTGTMDFIGMGAQSLLPFAKFERGKPVGIDPSRQHLLDNVLLVSSRCGFPPEEVLALWVIEGLPEWLPYELVSQADTHWKDVRGRPRNEEEARSFARSIVLFQRWGLDVLTPHVFNSRLRDNFVLFLPQAGKNRHDQAFRRGFEQEIEPVLVSSPFEYLSESGGGIDVRRNIRGVYEYKTKIECQSAMLCLQSSRFQTLKIQPPASFDDEDNFFNMDMVDLTPPFPALRYIYFNALKPENTVKRMIFHMKNTLRQKGASKRQYTVEDLQSFFLGNPLPQNLLDELREFKRAQNKIPLISSMMNAIRFECIRQAYVWLFFFYS